jgi:hypothetical protein
VGNVSAVEPLALLDESLRPDHFLHGAQPHGHVEDVIVRSMCEPLVVDPGDAIA